MSLHLYFQGYAYTFITEDQVRYAGDIIKALELSGSPVPPELEQLWASFKDQQKAVRHGTIGTQYSTYRSCFFFVFFGGGWGLNSEPNKGHPREL